MENEETPRNGPDHDEDSLKDRVAELEDRVARLEKEMESIAKMEKSISGLFGGRGLGNREGQNAPRTQVKDNATDRPRRMHCTSRGPFSATLLAAGLLALFPLAAQDGEVSERLAQLPFVPGSTTLAVLPDTQPCSQKYPHNFEAQTRWIVDNHRNRNIVYTLHLGDIVQNDAPVEWEVAKRCLGMLDGKVPYLLTPGNHDYREGGRRTRLSEYFPVAAAQEWPTFGGVFEEGRLDNNYHLFTIGKQEWIALGLEFGPRPKVMEWANEVLRQHQDRQAIIVTHGYLFRDNQRYDHRQGKQRASPHAYDGDGADGEELWKKVVSRHANVMIVICGHVRSGGLGYRVSKGDHGNTVHEMMANYQKLPSGGKGYMRLLEFQPDGKTVQVRTFSPATGNIRRSELEDFSFELKNADGGKP